MANLGRGFGHRVSNRGAASAVAAAGLATALDAGLVLLFDCGYAVGHSCCVGCGH